MLHLASNAGAAEQCLNPRGALLTLTARDGRTIVCAGNGCFAVRRAQRRSLSSSPVVTGEGQGFFQGAVDSGLENGRGMGTNGGISDSFADTFNLS